MPKDPTKFTILPDKKRIPVWFRHLLFLALCITVLTVLFMAPPETTPSLPSDPAHAPFVHMQKKEAELRCASCHSPDGSAPLPADHPSAYRCLLCHKQEPQAQPQGQTENGGCP